MVPAVNSLARMLFQARPGLQIMEKETLKQRERRAWLMIAEAFEHCDQWGEANIFGYTCEGICKAIRELKEATLIDWKIEKHMQYAVDNDDEILEGDGMYPETDKDGAAKRAKYCRWKADQIFEHAEFAFSELEAAAE